MNEIKEFFRDCFTNATDDYDLGRVLWAIAVVVFLFLAVYSVVVGKQTFDALVYGTGLGAVLGAGGMALWMKRDTEPKDVSNKPD